MRRYIDLVNLCESVTFHPSSLEVKDGETYIGVPDNFVRRVEEPCQDCEGTGKSNYNGGGDCYYCQGTGKEKNTVWDVPQMNVANRNARVISQILGNTVEYDDETSGWIPPEKIAETKRHLIRLMNSNTSNFEIEPTVDRGAARIDRSGDIPKITTGPTFYDFGLSESQIRSYIERLMEILDFAQKNKLGVSWA